MSEERHECGHTDEEHEDQLRYLMQQLAKGDLSVLVPRLSNENLELLLQAVVAEVLVRSETLEVAESHWDKFSEMVKRVYFPVHPDLSASPEHYADLMRGRETFKTQVEQYDFQTAVEAGIREMMETYGETDDPEG